MQVTEAVDARESIRAFQNQPVSNELPRSAEQRPRMDSGHRRLIHDH